MKLITAVKENNLTEIKGLLSGQCNVDETDEYGCTALYYAAELGNKEAVDALLSYNATIDSQNRLKETPLMRAIVKENDAIAEILLQHGANPDIGNSRGYTSVHMAALRNNLELVKLLVEKYNADITIKTKNSGTIMHCAATGVTEGRSIWDLVEWLLKHGVDPNAKNSSTFSVSDIFCQKDFSYGERYKELVTKLAAEHNQTLDE